MCLAVPARLVRRDGDEGTADLNGTQVSVCTLFAPEAEVGDWVLVHAGFVIGRLEPEQARRTWSILWELAGTIDGEEAKPAQGRGNADSTAVETAAKEEA